MEELRYSSENAMINRAIFLKEFGKPIVFVEDNDKEYWYENIFERMFPEISFSINPCGGKLKVEEAYNIFNNKYSDCKCIYICDGDFDVLIERVRINSSNFIYLKKYEIENYFVDEKSLLTLLAGRLHGSKKDVIKILNFNEWYCDTINLWYELMLAYIVAQKNNIYDIENSNINAEKYIKEKSYMIDINMIEEYKRELEDRLESTGKNIDEEMKKIHSKILKNNIEKDEIVKGKYLLVSANKYITELIKINKKRTPNLVKEDVFNILINTFDIKSLNYVKEKITDILTA